MAANDSGNYRSAEYLRRKKRGIKKRKALKNLRRFCILLFLLAVVVSVGRMVWGQESVGGLFLGEETEAGENGINAESLKDEAERNKNSAAWKKVFAHSERYPKRMLEILEKNPEILDFVKNYPNAEHKVNGGITKKEKKLKHPLFLQWDSRWGYAGYGDDNIGLSGCAPACLSMVLFSLTRDDRITPAEIAEFSMDGGYYMYGTGTSWSLLDDVAGHYGVSSREISLDQAMMENFLDEGGLIICSMRAGDFTSGGHFIVLYGYDGDGFRVNDPFSRIRSAQSWPYERLQGQIKKIWGYEK